MRNKEMAVKNAPASGLLKLRVTTTVSATAAAPENAAPARLSVLPLATSASLPGAGAVTAGIGSVSSTTRPSASATGSAGARCRRCGVSSPVTSASRPDERSGSGAAIGPAYERGRCRLSPRLVIPPEHRVGQHGDAKRRPDGVVGHHEDEGQQQDEDPRHPLRTGISPEPPGPKGEKGQIETRTDEAAADEQQPELPVVAHADLAALFALGRPPHRDRGDAALLMPGVAVSDDGRGKRITRREDRQ